MRLLARTWRIARVSPEQLERHHSAPDASGALFAMWHGRILLGLGSHPEEELTALVSPSGDGGLLEVLLRRFGFDVVRGSSFERGASALREILGLLRSGRSIVITPDGPRGPRHHMNEGLAWMARASGLPAVPCGLACDRAWRLGTWDRFTIPKIGARVVVVYGEPMYLGRRASDEEMHSFAAEIRGRMIANELRAFRELGVDPDFDSEPAP